MSDLYARLQELRERFDAGFAEPPRAAAGEQEDLLAIALGDECYLVRLREVEGLYLDRAVVAVPSHLPHLLGVSDFRGELIAVHDLAALLGYPPAGRARYVLRVAERPVAFAFERFVGHVRRLASQLTAADSATIVDLGRLVGELESRVASGEA